MELKFKAYIITTKQVCFHNKGLTLNEIHRLGDSYFREDVKWVQFTDKIDKFGVEIYVGDILQDDEGYLYEVVFGELPIDKSGDCTCNYPSFYAKGYGKLGYSPYYECNRIGDWMKVIGNRWSNPEILEAK